jgi:hypothetical protein
VLAPLRHFILEETLAHDGSDFILWYQHLRSCLSASDTLFVADEHLGDEPDDSTDEEGKRVYDLRLKLELVIQHAMLSTVDFDLRVQFSDTVAIDMIDTLKCMFSAEVRRAKYEYLGEFLSTNLEENGHLEMHLRNMHRIHNNLVHPWGNQTTESFAVDVVLRSPPPSYGEFV